MASSDSTPRGIAGNDSCGGGWAFKHIGQASDSAGQHMWLGMQTARSTTSGLNALIYALAKANATTVFLQQRVGKHKI